MEQSLYSFPFRKKKRYQVPYSVLKTSSKAVRKGRLPAVRSRQAFFLPRGALNSGFCRSARVWAFKASLIYETTCIVFTSF